MPGEAVCPVRLCVSGEAVCVWGGCVCLMRLCVPGRCWYFMEILYIAYDKRILSLHNST